MPGSTCKMVFTRSKKTFARFSSPLFALTLNTFTDASLPVSGMGMGFGVEVESLDFRDGVLEEGGGWVEVSSSIMSGCITRPVDDDACEAVEFVGRARTWGVKFPCEALCWIVSRPRI